MPGESGIIDVALSRVTGVKPSGVRKIFDLARAMPNPVNLSLGEPAFDIPEEIKEEHVACIRKGFDKYTPSGGIPELLRSNRG